MEAAPQSQTQSPQAGAGPGGAPAKISMDKFADGGIVCLRFSGTIDESFEGKKLAATIKAKTLILDLADIKKISSFGIREWVDFIRIVGDHVTDIVLIECAPKVVDQLNMVGNFAGKGRCFSFYAPFRCDYCDNDARVLFQVDRDWEIIKSMKPAERACEKCGEPQYFDEDPSTYFAYIVGQGSFELDPEVGAFLSSKLNYAVSESSRKLRVDKIIEGRSTFLKIAGDLDASFPREKLAEGLEGTVIIDVAGVGKIEPAGAAEWRGFLQMVTPSAESIFLLGVPPVFLEKLTRPEDLGPKGQVVTFSIPYTCNTCSTTSLHPVDVEQHYDVLKFATPPETRCGDCKNPMVCAASESLLSHLTTLPKPTISADTKKFIKEVRERKPEKKKAATTVAELAATQGRGNQMITALLAALVVAAIAIGAFVLYQQSKNAKARSAGLGKLTAKGAEARPAWLTSDTPSSSYCNDTDGGGMSCVGVSSATPTQEDAEDEAKDAALEAVANGLVVRMHDEKWDRLAALWSQTRAAKMAELEKDPTASGPRRAVRDGRKQVAALLQATAGAAIPPSPNGKYWEEYDNGAKQYLAFAQFQLSPSEVKGLVDSYNRTSTALGATVVTVYPMVAWRYPSVTKGAVIVGLDKGPLRDMGLAAEFVVLGVGNKEDALSTVGSAADFAEKVPAAFSTIEKPGGKMFVAIERGADEPKVYDLTVAPPKVETPPDHTGGGHTGGNGNNGGNHTGGSVNVWDRYGGSGSSGRDDPTQ